jgi:cytochrome c5
MGIPRLLRSFPLRSSGPLLLAGAVLASAAGASCGGGGGGGGEGGQGGDGVKSSFVVVHGSPADPAKEPESETQPIEGYASAMASGTGVVAVGTSTRVYVLGGTDPVALDPVGDEPNLPETTGQVRAMAPFDGGILVAAENGLFFTDGSLLQLSLANDALGPLGITAMTARVIEGADDGPPETRLALIAGGAAYELAGGEMTKWAVDGEEGAPTAVFAQEARYYVSFGSRTYEIDKQSKKAYRVKGDIGVVREIACGSAACDEGSLLYFASSAGLVERAADGVYRVFTLAAEGSPPVAVETFALDSLKQRLYALAGTHVLRVRAGEIPDAVATIDAPVEARHMAVDKAGDVWAGEGLAARRLSLGTPLSFLTDVRPILHEYCAECHATGTQGAPKRDFESYEVAVDRIDSILNRVEQGTMPPLSYGKKLPKDKILILEDWALTKAP